MGKLDVNAHSISFELDNPMAVDKTVDPLHRLKIFLPLPLNENSDVVAKKIDGATGKIHIAYHVKRLDIDPKAKVGKDFCLVSDEGSLSFDCYADESSILGLNVRILWMFIPGSFDSKEMLERLVGLTPANQLLKEMQPKAIKFATPSRFDPLHGEMIMTRPKIDPKKVERMIETFRTERAGNQRE